MDWILLAAAVVVGILSAARITRLVVQDDFPPAVWLRIRWDTVTDDGQWSKLVHCSFCASPYISAVVLATALIFDLHPVWWIINGWLAGSYLAAIVVQFDEGGD